MVLAASLAQGLPLCARAALGGDAASVEADRLQLRGEVHAIANTGYQVQEIQLPSGTVLREYVGASGKVFAVTWRGPARPDLRQILGSYFAHYQAATATPTMRRRLVTVDEPDLVVRSSGHMRAFTGRAYVPSLLPQNFSPADIR